MSELFLFVLLAAATLFVAFTNGANDNFKGVATLYGSNTVGYRTALAWATGATLLGSLTSLFFASELAKAFSGKGLVPDAIAGSPEFLAAVAVGAALTVLLATRLGFPISTTHALTGALVGAGLAEAWRAIDVTVLGSAFFLPLVMSPVLAICLGGMVYPGMRRVTSALGVSEEWCVCTRAVADLSPSPAGDVSLSRNASIEITMEGVSRCSVHDGTRILGVTFPPLLDVAHFASAGAVSFARGLNDTPKILGLFVVMNSLDLRISLTTIAVAMAAGGLVFARRVAETMSRRITSMDRVQGLTANLVTSGLVLTASWSGLPVSTTHVSCGALFGMGLVTRQADMGVLRQVVLSWVLTLPVGGALAAATVLLLSAARRSLG